MPESGSPLLPFGRDESPQWARFPRPFAGVDEAGRGCLAGPVVAAAVILPHSGADGSSVGSSCSSCAYDLPGLDDSKKLTAAKRVKLEPEVKAQAVAWGLGVVRAREIDNINILQATFLAMSRAIAAMKVEPVFVAIDGNQRIPDNVLAGQWEKTFSGAPAPQQTIKGGDALVPAISAASILAKTFRDRLMSKLDKRYPEYGFAGHKGYGAKKHLEALKKHGPCPLHRLTFRGVLPDEQREQQKGRQVQCRLDI